MNEIDSQDSDQSDEIDFLELDQIIEEQFNNDKENLIMILQAIQNRYNYLPQASVKYLSEKIGIPLSEIYGVETFYKTFSLEPRGRNLISICLGTACHVRETEKVKDKLEGALKINAGETTKDGRFTLEPVRCIGCCSHGPMVKINEDLYSGMSPDKIQKVLDKYK